MLPTGQRYTQPIVIQWYQRPIQSDLEFVMRVTSLSRVKYLLARVDFEELWESCIARVHVERTILFVCSMLLYRVLKVGCTAAGSAVGQYSVWLLELLAKAGA